MQYKITFPAPLKHLIHVEFQFEASAEETIIQLPAWRPGRYELANYAKNLYRINARNNTDQPLKVAKVSKDRWTILNGLSKEVTISYYYYAAQMDAGGSWVDENLIYINFINCLVFIPGKENQPCSAKIDIPSTFKVATPLEKEGEIFVADSFYHIADSPLMASTNLKHLSYEINEIRFNIWISGEVDFIEQKLVNDFLSFTSIQLETMGTFPEKDYHFLLHILPYRHYHGVEHASSTVITLGPANEFSQKSFYHNLLGISSHELFHAWNICKIRPAEMLPYNFSQENYFETGFVAEGFTTYYGDLFLVRSKVFEVQDYFDELNHTFKRHFENYGRSNYSLSESSFDLWLDGYVAGTPERKVSIYVKGCIIALMLDLSIRQQTDGHKSLDDLMRVLWDEYGKKQKGYTAGDINRIVQNLTQSGLDDFFDYYVFGTKDEEAELSNLLGFVGCKLEKSYAGPYNERYYGFRLKQTEGKHLVELIAPESPAEKFLGINDEILEVNGKRIQELPVSSLEDETELDLKILRNYHSKVIKLPKGEKTYFPQYRIKKNMEAGVEQRDQFKLWLYRDF